MVTRCDESHWGCGPGPAMLAQCCSAMLAQCYSAMLAQCCSAMLTQCITAATSQCVLRRDGWHSCEAPRHNLSLRRPATHSMVTGALLLTQRYGEHDCEAPEHVGMQHRCGSVSRQ